MGEVVEAIHRGVRRSNPRAEAIVWDWGCPEEMSRKLIPRLPKDMRQLSVSEWSTPIERGGVKTQIDAPGANRLAHDHYALFRTRSCTSL